MEAGNRLLIITQAVDRNDPALGFFVDWILELSKHRQVSVICLKEGNHDLPSSIPIYSLGKEKGKVSTFTYAYRFYKLAWSLRGSYDSVFVHMNQEYILLFGDVWKLLEKKIYLWRNHHSGSFLTNVAAYFCTKIFCTSKYSYTAQFKKTVLMPVGIDTDKFSPNQNTPKMPHSVLFLARLDRSKQPEVFLQALGHIKEKGAQFTATLVGSPSDPKSDYEHYLRNRAQEYDLGGSVQFRPGVTNNEAVSLFRTSEIFVNCSSSGMYDKTIFEAMSAGSLVLASNKNLEGVIDNRQIFTEGDAKEAAKKLEVLLQLSTGEKEELIRKQRDLVIEKHSLHYLGSRLTEEIS